MARMAASAAEPEAYPETAQKRRGIMLVLASPPGGGKTTVSHALRDSDTDMMISVSATTRAMRPGEVDGEHYHFVTREQFQKMIDDGEMMEYALVYNDYMYGTPRKKVEEQLSAGRDVIFDIDWQGMRSLSDMAPEDVVTVYLLPPSWGALEDRLRARAQDSREEISRRLNKAQEEISHYSEFQYVVINNDLDETIDRVRAIVTAERQKRLRQPDIDSFVETLKPD
ncbi:MAG: guanylate kinase [Alphaproteobacteria bacterium]|nr:guanylate kinase [Alphaproteobacteria bacterium]